MAFKIFNNIKELLNLNKTIASKTEELNKLIENIKQIESDTKNILAEKDKIIEERDNEIEKTRNSIKDTIQQYAEEKDKIIRERDNEIEKTKKNIEETIDRYKERTDYYKNQFTETQSSFIKVQRSLDEINTKIASQNNKIEQQKNALKLIRFYQKEILNTIDIYSTVNIDKLPKLSELDSINSSFELTLHSLDVKSLQSLAKENNKIIEKILSKYENDIYNTKYAKAIFQLIVISMRAELQNIIINMKFNTIDKCKDSFNKMITRYFKITYDEYQAIAPNLNTFISEIKILFEKSIDIEYEYYVKKEQERAEQQALREQMRQEAEERKELERQQKLVEREEEKFKAEIEYTQKQLNNCQDNDLLLQLQEKIKQLQEQLQAVEEKKEEIINLQNGKAGYVYIISNLGSFGDNRFKIGMTRRINPIERINELGSASVPFKFDVHSFIFSEDAVGLEHSLHTNLSDKRTNKVNLRKEFFDISIDELENLVQELDPTAEFNKTMLATEYRQSLSIQEKNNCA